MENDNVLTKELLKRTFGNLGAVPGINFGKVGITADEFLINKKIRFKEESDIKERNIWAAQFKTDNSYRFMLTNLGSKEVPDFLAIIISENMNPIGLRLLWDDQDPGEFLTYNGESWQGISTLYKLNITVAIEMATREGVAWYNCESSNEIYELFIKLVNLD